MKKEKLKVKLARKFLGGLGLILALSSYGCGFNKKAEPIVDSNVGIEESKDIVDELDDIINEFGAELEETQSESQTETDTDDYVMSEWERKSIDTDTDDNIDDYVMSEWERKSIFEEENSVEEDTQLNINENNEIVLDNGVVIPNIGDYQGNSIVVALARAGYDSSYLARKELATKLGIENYRGTAEQNIKLLKLLKGYYEQLMNYINNNTNKEEQKTENNEQNENDRQNVDNSDNSNNNQNTNDDNNNNNPGHGGNGGSSDEEHRHSYRTTTTYEYDDDGHVLVTIKSCNCGDEVITRSSKEDHTLNYLPNSDGKTETATCKCGYIHTRDIQNEEHKEHDFSIELGTEYIVDENGESHILVTLYECKDCNAKDEQVTDQHNADWISDGIDKENNIEKFHYSICGKTKVEDLGIHDNHTPSEPRYENRNGQCIEIRYCPDCDRDYEKEVQHEPETISEFSNNSVHVTTTSCKHCGYIMENTHEEEHSFNGEMLESRIWFGKEQGKFVCQCGLDKWINLEDLPNFDQNNESSQLEENTTTATLETIVTSTYSEKSADALVVNESESEEKETEESEEEIEDETETIVVDEQNSDGLQANEQNGEPQAYVVSDDVYDEIVAQIIQDMNLENEELVEQENVVTDEKTTSEDAEKVLSLGQ